jgi:hypothetical protein
VAAHAADRDGGAGNAALEWFTSYADYLKRVANQSSSTIDLYQEVTNRIVRGELEPAATQDLLTSFVRDRGTAYSDELGELNARFFREMVRIGTAYAHELGQAVLPEAALPPAPPPEFDPENPAGWFQELTAYSQRLGTSVAATYQALVDRAASGEIAPGQIQEAATEHLQRRLPEYLGELGRLYFELLNGLTDLRIRSEHEFLNGVLAQTNGAAEAFELSLTAPLGEHATASITITNTRDELAHVRCNVTDARRADGVDAAFAPDIGFTPEILELEPRAEARLEVSLRLDEDHYEPGTPYVAMLQITGHGEPRLEVPLRIMATRAVPTQSE